MKMLLHIFVLIFVCLVIGSVRCQIHMKYFQTEEVCAGEYGTVLESQIGVRGKTECGSRCIQNNCTSFVYNGQSKLCTLNSETFDNRTTNGCSYLVYYAEAMNDQINSPAVPAECGPVPIIPSIVVNSTGGNFSIGLQLPYTCIPCTSFPPFGSPAVIECGSDGTWILPQVLCEYGPDVGHLHNGYPIPASALGCVSEYNTTCPLQSSSVLSGLRFDGIVDICYCDGACCNAGDCCYDTTCEQVVK